MNNRLDQLKELLEELKSDSYADQYGLADWVKTDTNAEKQMKLLRQETQFYKKILEKIDTMTKGESENTIRVTKEQVKGAVKEAIQHLYEDVSDFTNNHFMNNKNFEQLSIKEQNRIVDEIFGYLKDSL